MYDIRVQTRTDADTGMQTHPYDKHQNLTRGWYASKPRLIQMQAFVLERLDAQIPEAYLEDPKRKQRVEFVMYQGRQTKVRVLAGELMDAGLSAIASDGVLLSLARAHSRQCTLLF